MGARYIYSGFAIACLAVATLSLPALADDNQDMCAALQPEGGYKFNPSDPTNSCSGTVCLGGTCVSFKVIPSPTNCQECHKGAIDILDGYWAKLLKKYNQNSVEDIFKACGGAYKCGARM